MDRDQSKARAIVSRLIAHLVRNDFKIIGVFDGEEVHKVYFEAQVLELVFNLDEASLRVRRIGAHLFGDSVIPWPLHDILLVPGNDEDILSDWNYSDGDPDGFNRVMDAFEPY